MAAARLGGKVNFITALGDDNFAQQLKLEFINEKIDTSGIITIAGEHTGIALIMIDSNGENCIAVNSGANALLTPQHIDVLSHIIEQSGIIVMQAEIPYETVKHCAKIAKRASVAVLYGRPAAGTNLPGFRIRIRGRRNAGPCGSGAEAA